VTQPQARVEIEPGRPWLRAWLKWTALFALLGFGFGIGLTALGYHDRLGHAVVRPLASIGFALALAVFFGLAASLTAALVNFAMALSLRGRARPDTWLDRLPLSARVMAAWTACGAAFGLIVWATSVNR